VTARGRWMLWCIGALLTVLGFMLAVRLLVNTAPPIRILGSQREVTSSADGHSFTVRREACLLHIVPGHISPRLRQVDGPLHVSLIESEERLSLGCQVFEILTIVPPEVPKGDYWYDVTTRYQTSPVTTITVNWPPVLVHILD